MIKPFLSPTPLLAVFFLAFCHQALAQTRTVDFHAYSSVSPETGVQAKIKIIFPDHTTVEFKTPRNGRTSIQLKRCDKTVIVEARSVWGDHTKTTTDCDPVPVEISMAPQYKPA